MSEAEARKAEIKRIKEAEEEAIAKALGYDIPPKESPGDNPNTTKLGGDKYVDKTVRDGLEQGAEGDNIGRGLGFGGFAGISGATGDDVEVMEGTIPDKSKNSHDARHPPQPDDRSRKNHRRSNDRRKHRRSRSRDHERRKNDFREKDDDKRRHHRHRRHSMSRSRSREHRRRSSVDRNYDRDYGRHEKRHEGHERHHDDSRRIRHPHDRPSHGYRNRSRSP